MIDTLTLLLRIAGIGLILLAILHFPIAKSLKWREEAKLMTPVNESIFHVHTFFICVVLVMMGLPSLLEPRIFLEPSRAGLWLAGSLSFFWFLRLYCQWFVYQADLWRRKRMETAMHLWFTFVWTGLGLLYGTCFMIQLSWLKL